MTTENYYGLVGLSRPGMLPVPPWELHHLPQASELLLACT